MIGKLARKIFGTFNDRKISSYKKQVLFIDNSTKEYADHNDEKLISIFQEIKSRSASEEEDLYSIFALVREASKRTIGLSHYESQMIGGLSLIEGNISEMGTGEGKTLVATLSATYYAAKGKKVHIVTVNDYLAKRDADEMAPIFNFFGLTVSSNNSLNDKMTKKDIYAADIIYGTNSEFGFDYLRDNLVTDVKNKAQTGLDYCLVDEVDSILIDEARTPLIISGPAQDSEDMCNTARDIVNILTDEDVVLDEKSKTANLSEDGYPKVEESLIELGLIKDYGDLYNASGLVSMHYLNAALKARFMLKKDIDYLVIANEVKIIDEFTGRTMEGRRWSNGIHQAVESKELVEIHPENETVASITYQNYFRMYETLSGMTGTAKTEEAELKDIYGLQVIQVPPNKLSSRVDENDKMYSTKEFKYKAILEDIKASNVRGQPVLIGTPSVEVSEVISIALSNQGLEFEVLNAKNHEKEAHIIENAGCLNAVTIATNMAGRGTDIKLGKSQGEKIKVIEAGGLRVIGVERQENRRLDNQLRGRSGRQGDAGSTCFYMSPEDDLLRIFGGDKLGNLMKKISIGDEVIEHGFLTKAILNSQKKVEGHNFDIRKNLLKYDDVSGEQRRHIYTIRDKILTFDSAGLDKYIFHVSGMYIDEVFSELGLDQVIPDEDEKEKEILQHLRDTLGFAPDTIDNVREDLKDIFKSIIEDIDAVTTDQIVDYKRSMVLQALDSEWISHLKRLDEIRNAVHLRGYAQKDPLKEYQSESFDSFKYMLDTINSKVTGAMITILQDFAKMQDEGSNNSGWLVSDKILNGELKSEN